MRIAENCKGKITPLCLKADDHSNKADHFTHMLCFLLLEYSKQVVTFTITAALSK